MDDRSYDNIRKLIGREIRLIWSRYDPSKKLALELAKVKLPKYNKNGKKSKKYGVAYKCNNCGGLYDGKDINVHHIDHIGSLFDWPTENTKGVVDDWILRLFCKVSNLRVLCTNCHKKEHHVRKI